MFQRQSLYSQILLLVSVVLATSLASYGWLVSKRQAQAYQSLISQEVEISARNMAELSVHHLVVEDYAAMEYFLLRAADLPDVRQIKLCEPNGHILVDIVRPPGGQPGVKYNAQPLVPPPGTEIQHSFDEKKEEHVVWYPLQAGQLLGWLQLTVGMESVAPLQQEVWKSAALIGVVWISAGVLLLLLSLRPPLLTIRRLADFARILNSRKGEEITVRSSAREIMELATALNFASRELRSSEDSLLRERERLAVIIRSIGDGVIACDPQGRILLMNGAAERLTASVEHEGCLLADILIVADGAPGRIPSLLAQALKTDQVQPLGEVQIPLALPAGDTRTVLLSIAPLLDTEGKPVGTVTVLRDVTERVRMEEEKQQLEIQLRQAQKMEAVGTLAGGIAHDFNNILAAISGYTELAQLDLPGDSKPWQHLQQVQAACLRAKDLITQILTFSRKGDQEQLPIQMHHIVKEALKLLRSSIPTSIDFRQNIDAACGSVLANPTEIHQIIMNLCVNAFHAMRDRGQGVLSVSLARAIIEPADVERMGLEIAPGSYVCLSVGDTGHGMDQNVMEKIFDPYFTTKKKGEGTGMGLAMVHGIVKKGGGHIKVYSEPGKGSTFKIYLPEFHSTDPRQHQKEPVLTTLPPGGSERILLVDDEPSLVMLGTNLLRGLGYQVESAIGSREALERFQGNPAAFDLVITDMTMPEMNGAELAQAILRVRPDLPIIVCSGYTEAIANLQISGIGIRATLQKPYLRRTLANTVRSTLDTQMVAG